MILKCYVDDETWRRLQLAVRLMNDGRDETKLAEAAIAEAALDATRDVPCWKAGSPKE